MRLAACAIVAMISACVAICGGGGQTQSSQIEEHRGHGESVACCSVTTGPTILVGTTEIPEWCRGLPRPEYKSLKRVAVSDAWFEVYKVAPRVFAIYEPHQAEEIPEWCRGLPRPEYKTLERVAVSDSWFEVY